MMPTLKNQNLKFDKKSRRSSLTYLQDNQIDQLSMNFGANQMLGKPDLNKDKTDVQSVASIITKGGGSIFKGLSHNESNKIYLARSIKGGLDEFSLERGEIKENFAEHISSPAGTP